MSPPFCPLLLWKGSQLQPTCLFIFCCNNTVQLLIRGVVSPFFFHMQAVIFNMRSFHLTLFWHIFLIQTNTIPGNPMHEHTRTLQDSQVYLQFTGGNHSDTSIVCYLHVSSTHNTQISIQWTLFCSAVWRRVRLIKSLFYDQEVLWQTKHK